MNTQILDMTKASSYLFNLKINDGPRRFFQGDLRKEHFTIPDCGSEDITRALFQMYELAKLQTTIPMTARRDSIERS